MAPEAPGWFTTTTSTPSASARMGAVTRVTWSVDPPAPHGTIRLIGRSGCHSWAAANPVVSINAGATASRERVNRDMDVLPFFLRPCVFPSLADCRKRAAVDRLCQPSNYTVSLTLRTDRPILAADRPLRPVSPASCRRVEPAGEQEWIGPAFW